MLLCQKYRKHWAKTFQYPKLPTISWMAWCLIPVPATFLQLSHVMSLWWTHWIFFVSLSTGNSQTTITGRSTMPVPIFKILYPSSDTTPKNASPFACWHHAWIHDMGISSLIRNSITACYQITCPFQLFSCTEIWPHKGDVIFILVWEDRWN